jgi:tRNA (guanine-N7-)-methyltransferase
MKLSTTGGAAMISWICSSTIAATTSRASRIHGRSVFGAVAAFSSPSTGQNSSPSSVSTNPENDETWSPWTDPRLEDRSEGKQTFRSRQHVNPLASKFQQPTVLSPDWPSDVFKDLSRPLFLDIGCARGGFLVDFASQRPDDYNYLGLEIRPIVVRQAQTRIAKHGLEGFLDFVGCNANVDLERLLTIGNAKEKVEMVTIQFPDPHFKARHAKRRVVTPELVLCLAKFMPASATVFLQSDIQSVLDEMRLQFRQQPELFQDDVESVEEYLPENIFGIPTEREVSVLEKGLPVYRTTFKRTTVPVSAVHEEMRDQ